MPRFKFTIQPSSWQEWSWPVSGQQVFKRNDGLAVIYEGDDRGWIHVSCSYQDRLPTWDDLREVKDLFIGRDVHAVQILPAAAEYVNVNPNVLHLWAKPDGSRIVPDMRRPNEGGVI